MEGGKGQEAEEILGRDSLTMRKFYYLNLSLKLRRVIIIPILTIKFLSVQDKIGWSRAIL